MNPIQYRPSSYLQTFTLGKTLYQSETTKIIEALKHSTQNKPNIKRAIKIIQINPNETEKIKRIEKYYNLMKKVENSHVVKVYETFFVKNSQNASIAEYWIVMDFCHFKSLDSYFIGDQMKNDQMKKYFISDIAVGLEYIHKTIGYHHNYLCPENILLQKDLTSVYPKVKINNFAIIDEILEKSKISQNSHLNESSERSENSEICEIGEISKTNEFYEICESNENYQPPEFINNIIHQNSDVWSFGMIIFYLMQGKTIYEEVDLDYFNTCSVELELPFEVIENESCRDLLQKMLVYDPNQRISLEEVLKHPFIQNCIDSKYQRKGKIENYTPISFLGNGRFGDVILAKNIDGDFVAVKEIGSENEYKQEVCSLKKEAFIRHCKHPNIVEYKDHCESDESFIAKLGNVANPNEAKLNSRVKQIIKERKNKKGKYFFLIMEYCDYQYTDLEKYINYHKKHKEGQLSNAEILHFLGDIAGGLHYLHYQRGIVHRDLKPENLMLKSNGENNLPTVKIADYGFARAYTDEMGTTVGTQLYEAPEIYRKEKYTNKCDLYSVGVILYYMATFQYPFTDDPQQFRQLMNAKVECEIPYDVEINEELEDLILGLVTQYEKDRLSWKEFFEHPFVVKATNQKLHSSRLNVVKERDEIVYE